MSGSCEKYREKIAALLAGDLSHADALLVEEHVEACPACRRYLDGVQEDDRLLKAFVRSVHDNIGALEAKIMAAIDGETTAAPAVRRKSAARIRRLVRSRRLKVVAAAVVLVGIVASADLLFNKGGANIVWADVLQRVEDAQDFICRVRQDESIGADVDMVEYRSTRYGYRQDIYRRDDGKLAAARYLKQGENVLYTLIHRDKTYAEEELTGQQAYDIINGASARMLVRMFRSMGFEELGRKQIDGKTVSGIEINDPPIYKTVYEHSTIRLWVDMETGWPARIEIEGDALDGEARVKLVMDRFQWNPSLSEEDFEFEIPEDYKRIARMVAGRYDESSALEGLREYARFSGGRYPGSLVLATAFHEVDDEIAGLRRGIDWSEKDFNQLMKIYNTCAFYAELLENEQDAAYHGEEVGPRDFDRVLLRWRLEDGRYRVVYGDLRAETVSPAALRELEKKR